MRHVAVVAVTSMLVLVVNASAQLELLSARQPDKIETAAVPNIPNPERQSGDTIATAFVIPALPYAATGTTTGYNNDYDEACPYTTSTAPDVVYAFTPAHAMQINIDMYGSLFDTKIYLYDASLNLVACNDDYYPDYVSALQRIDVSPTIAPYFLVIDGYGSEHGEYMLSVLEYVPCVLDSWYDVDEGEPPLDDGYIDSHNGGCNSPEFGNPFQALIANGQHGGFTFAGRSGWYVFQGADWRDTDWFIVHLDYDGHISIAIDAEEPVFMFQLAPLDCETVAVVQTVSAGPCSPVTMDLHGSPYEQLWLWVGPQTFTPPSGFTGHEFRYTLEIWNSDAPHLFLGPSNDYTFPAPMLVHPYTWFTVSPDPDCVDDVDLADLCGGTHTPGPDFFAQVYLGAGDRVSGWMFPMYPMRETTTGESPRSSLCLSLVSDLRDPAATCLGNLCGFGYNHMFMFPPAAQSGWYFLVADYTEPGEGVHHAWAEIYRDVTPAPAPPAHDDCAGAVTIPQGDFAIYDDLTNATNAVDPGRDGCMGDLSVSYTGRDLVYRVSIPEGHTLDVALLPEGGWDAALYLVNNCVEPIGACVAAGQFEDGGVRLRYTAQTHEDLWLICDSHGLGERPFVLQGRLDTTVGVQPHDHNEPPAVPTALAVAAAPNPFNPWTRIEYTLPRGGRATLRLFSLDGKLLRIVIDQEHAAGRHEVLWDGRDARGSAVASGAYLLQLESGGRIASARVLMLK